MMQWCDRGEVMGTRVEGWCSGVIGARRWEVKCGDMHES
jgi:hypothetical protein